MLKKISIILLLIVIISGCNEEIFAPLDENNSVRFFGTTGRDNGVDVLSGNNAFYVLGSILNNGSTKPGIFTLDFNGKQINPPIIIQNEIDNVVIDFTITDENDFYVLTNSLPTETTQNSVVHLVKISADGTLIWQKDFLERNNISARQMLIHNNNIYIVGSVSTNTGSGEDGWLLVLDIEGTIIREYTYGGSLNDGLVSIVPMDNDLLMLGNTQSFDIGNKSGDIWLIRTDLNGSIKGYNTFGTPGSDMAISIVKQSENTVFVLGRSTKSLSEGYKTLISCVNPVSLSIDWQKEYSTSYSLLPQSMIWWNNTLVIVQNEEISSNFTQVGFLYYTLHGELLQYNQMEGEIGISARKIYAVNENEFLIIGTHVFRGNSDIAFFKFDEDSEFFN